MLYPRATQAARRYTARSVFKDTIYALATGWGKSAVSVVRVSGPNAFQALALTRQTGAPKAVKPRHAYFRTFYDVLDRDKDEKARAIDEGILLCFKQPNSFTGEDMVEFQIHGGMAVKSHLLKTLAKFDSFREAQPVSEGGINVVMAFLYLGRVHEAGPIQRQT